jgi:hypothetical protein
MTRLLRQQLGIHENIEDGRGAEEICIVLLQLTRTGIQVQHIPRTEKKASIVSFSPQQISRIWLSSVLMASYTLKVRTRLESLNIYLDFVEPLLARPNIESPSD